MKSFWQIGQMINTLSATLTMTYQSRYLVHPYALVNRSVLYNCGIEVTYHFLLESLAACQDTNSKLVMCFTVNTALVNYLDQFHNLTESLKFWIIKNTATFEQILPISLDIS